MKTAFIYLFYYTGKKKANQREKKTFTSVLVFGLIADTKDVYNMKFFRKKVPESAAGSCVRKTKYPESDAHDVSVSVRFVIHRNKPVPTQTCG